jgi:hypothetical protein
MGGRSGSQKVKCDGTIHTPLRWEGLAGTARGVTMWPWLAPTAIPLLTTFTAAIRVSGGLCRGTVRYYPIGWHLDYHCQCNAAVHWSRALVLWYVSLLNKRHFYGEMHVQINSNVEKDALQGRLCIWIIASASPRLNILYTRTLQKSRCHSCVVWSTNIIILSTLLWDRTVTGQGFQ